MDTRNNLESDTKRRLEAKKKLTPATGFNVVAVDSYERDPDCELVLVAHFETREEADAKCAAVVADGGTAYVYAPDTL
jgi:hypothetical protein